MKKMQQMNKVVKAAALFGVVAVAGCRTVEDILCDYNSNIAAGNYQEAAIEVTECAQDKDGDRLMWHLLSGSAYQLAGDALKANQQFDQAEDVMLEQDQSSVFSKGASGAWAMMTNDKAFDYSSDGQDRIFACLYKAINYAVEGDPDAARTELNRASQHQENWLYARRKDIASAKERMEKDVDAYNKEKNNGSADAPDSGAMVDKAFANEEFASQILEKCGFDPRRDGILDNLQPVDWMNPYVSHLTGVFRWLNGDDARNHFKDAAACGKDNRIAARDFAECDRGVRPKNQVWIWVEDGLCAERKEWEINLPTIFIPYAGNYVMYVGMALPYLEPRSQGADHWRISSSVGSVPMAEIADIDKLLKVEYDVYMRGALAREITRVIVKAGSQAALGIAADNTSDWRVQLALKASQVAVAAWAASVTDADTRSWTALPKRVHVARVDRPSDGRIQINASCGNVAEVIVPEGNTMVFVSKPGPLAKAAVRTVTYR